MYLLLIETLSHGTMLYRRAAKCYQKVLDIQPTNTEAAMCLGDVLTASGEEVRCTGTSCHMTVYCVSLFHRIERLKCTRRLWQLLFHPGSVCTHVCVCMYSLCKVAMHFHTA